MKIATVVLGLLLGVVLHATPANADMPVNVHDGRSGVVDAGWMRVLCASSSDGVKCAIRVPGGYSRMNLDAHRGDETVMTEKSRAYPLTRPTTGPRDRLRGRVAPGIRVRCTAEGNVVSCRLRLAQRISNLNLTLYSAGTNQGGPTGRNF